MFFFKKQPKEVIIKKNNKKQIDLDKLSQNKINTQKENNSKKTLETYHKEYIEGKRYIKLADHMLTQTYPLIKDPKLLLAVLDDVFLAFDHTMNSILYCERFYKKIPPFHNNFESRFNIFKKEIAVKNQKLKKFIPIIEDLKTMINAHKRSPIEFVRKDKFVISTEDYKLKTITKEEMEKKIKESKEFLKNAKEVLMQYERSYK